MGKTQNAGQPNERIRGRDRCHHGKRAFRRQSEDVIDQLQRNTFLLISRMEIFYHERASITKNNKRIEQLDIDCSGEITCHTSWLINSRELPMTASQSPSVTAVTITGCTALDTSILRTTTLNTLWWKHNCTNNMQSEAGVYHAERNTCALQ